MITKQAPVCSLMLVALSGLACETTRSHPVGHGGLHQHRGWRERSGTGGGSASLAAAPRRVAAPSAASLDRHLPWWRGRRRWEPWAVCRRRERAARRQGQEEGAPCRRKGWAAAR
jgi:hypothetical protein